MIYTVLRSTAGVAHNKRGGYLIMVAGHLREKKGYFYAVLNYTDAHGNRKTKWIATGLAVKGNKKRAEAFLQEQRRSFKEDVPITGDVLFADFMEQWLTVKERLLELKAEQEENRRLCGRSYVKDYTGYVCINEIGDIIKPNYVSCGFPKLLEEHGLRRVRYHDLRHSCASLLLANGVPMKQIQEWLGHSDFSTTANIYAHLEYSSKVISADAMLAGLGIGNRE